MVASAPWASDASPSSEATRFLAAHNRERVRVGSPPLRWSQALESRAAEWAVFLADHNQFRPRRDGRSGENLFEMYGGVASPEDVVSAWVSESRSYSPQTNTCRARCGHYTQVVWSESVEVGCGSAQRGLRQVWVCNYNPPGNVLGERPFPLK
jgi:pathogenesis-related protein 1